MGIIVRGLIVHISGLFWSMVTDPLRELGKRIRQRRKELGWTQDEFALRAEIDRSYVGGVERGQRNLSFTVLCRFCVALECDVAALTKDVPRKAA
jgi:transcriptional regulator with XRE-family HTH domain